MRRDAVSEERDEPTKRAVQMFPRFHEKVEHDPLNPRHLLTEPGVGYRLLAEEST